MANSVDDKVVSMQFDNASFEKKIASTIQSISDLQKSLDMANAKQGLQDVGRAAKSFDMSQMSSAIEGVSAKFIALSTIAITVLSQITSKAVDAGLRIVKSLSLDQVISGFQEYETNMKSIQTILANTKADNTNLDQVNAALDQLNTYADKTIYNFGEMARNIGTFTAAGVDLETSVSSIKGIANAAAISGSTSAQASTAMYQLSQAIASGSLKLMDWNSVVNAGMGGEVMQKALFDTGKAMKTIAGVPLSMTFDEWKAKGNTFRESLQDGWVTTEVLTTALKGFSGEATDAELAAKGFSDVMIAEFRELGETGVEAATKVRTFTQLVDTVKEAIGSGWSSSFRTVLGDFEEATELFTNISEAIGTMVGNSADARNAFLRDWKVLGGRDSVIAGVTTAFQNLGLILKPIKEAFREVFPPMTASRLAVLSEQFRKLMVELTPTYGTVTKIKNIFKGLFSALEIGWTIIKEGAKFFGSLFSTLTDGLGGGAFEKLSDLGKFITDLNERLVAGGGIISFFERLTEIVKDPLPYILALKDRIVEFVKSLDVEAPTFLADALGRLSDRFAGLKSAVDKIKDLWEPVKGALLTVVDVLDEVWVHIKTWFSELGGKMGDAAEEGDFDAVIDAINVGLLGGIAVILAKFFKDGFKLDFGGGVLDSLTDTFGELTGVLSAMQTDLKANALIKIAGAIALLTASVLVLSLIDSAALTKALAAMAVGFGQLMASFAILTKLMADPKAVASFGVLAAGLILLAGAMLLLSVAVKILSTLSWEEMAKGLVGVIGLLGALAGAVQLMSGNAGGMIRIGASLLVIAGALTLLAIAMKIFATMSWEEMAKGFAGVVGGLTGIALAMKLMPKSLPVTASGMIAIGAALILLSVSMKIFATMSWEEIAKGFVGVTAGLIGIAGAMQLMPKTLPITAAGLIMVGAALLLIASAMKMVASMSWEEIGKGLVGIAGALLILAVATNAMTGAIAGAVAIGIVSLALRLLAEVVKEFAKISWGDLLKGLVGIAAALAVLAIAAIAMGPAIIPMLALGAALTLIGVGFALFGIGASLVAKSFEILARVGKAGSETLVVALEAIGYALPVLIKGFAQGLVELVLVIIEAMPVILEQLTILVGQILDTLIELLPKFGEFIVELVSTLIEVLRELTPQLIEAGYELLINLLTGLRDNIGEVATLVYDIMLELIGAITEKIPEIVAAGLNVMLAFVQGLLDNISAVVDMVGTIVTTLIDSLAGLAGDIAAAGLKALTDFLTGITNNLSNAITAIGTLVTTMITAVGNLARDIARAGTDALVDFLGGITDNLIKVTTAVGEMITKFITAVGGQANNIIRAGVDTIISFIEGVGRNAVRLANAAADVIIDFINGIARAIETHSGELREAGKRLGLAIADGMTFGLASKVGDVVSGAKNLAGKAAGAIGGFLGINSPAKLIIPMGEAIAEGLALGMDEGTYMAVDSVDAMGKSVETAMVQAIAGVSEAMQGMNEFNPVITPVLDLNQVMSDAKKLSKIVPAGSSLSPSLSYSHASTIAGTETDSSPDSVVVPSGPTEVKFEQNNYSPKALSTADIYRQSKNQLALAKEELSIS